MQAFLPGDLHGFEKKAVAIVPENLADKI